MFLASFLTASISIIMLTAGFAVLFNRKFELVLPVAVLTDILVLFVFLRFGILNIGYVVVLGVSGIMLLVAIPALLARSRGNRVKNNILTVGFFVFIIFLVAIYLDCVGRGMTTYDQANQLPSIVNQYISDSYSSTLVTPVAPLSYLFTKLKGTANYGLMYAAANIFTFSLVGAPVIGYIKSKNVIYKIAGAVAAIVVPAITFNVVRFYNSLDNAAWYLLVAYMLIVILLDSQCAFKYVALGMALGVAMLEPDKAVFLMFILMVEIVDIVFFRRKEFSGVYKAAVGGVTFLTSILIPAAVYFLLGQENNYGSFITDFIDKFSRALGMDTCGSAIGRLLGRFTEERQEGLQITILIFLIVFLIEGIVTVILAKGTLETVRKIVLLALVWLLSAGMMFYNIADNIIAGTRPQLSQITAVVVVMAIVFMAALIVEITVRFENAFRMLILIPMILALVCVPYADLEEDIIEEKADMVAESDAEVLELPEYVEGLGVRAKL